MKVRRLQSAISGGRGPDTRHTCAGEWDIWDYRTLINSLSERRSLWACLCRCRGVQRVDGGSRIGRLHLFGLESGQHLGWASQDSLFICWKVNAPSGTALQWTNYYIFLWCPQRAVLDTLVTSPTSFSADLSWQDAGIWEMFLKRCNKKKQKMRIWLKNVITFATQHSRNCSISNAASDLSCPCSRNKFKTFITTLPHNTS